uniref:Uncharacterized protein n=1 Tax=Anguilla anguilla TaxID=7936 RepID=A0A0E9P9F5_ANGAN
MIPCVRKARFLHSNSQNLWLKMLSDSRT